MGAEGGIITKPSFGLMGEAGPEALTPLPDGLRNLGGGRDMSVVVNVSTQPGTTAEVRRSRGPSVQEQIDVMVVSSVGRQLQRNGPLGQTLQPDGPTSGLR